MIRGGAFYDRRWPCCVGSVLCRCGLLIPGSDRGFHVESVLFARILIFDHHFDVCEARARSRCVATGQREWLALPRLWAVSLRGVTWSGRIS